MKRKVIKQGNNTLTVTLPKKWTARIGIKAGDEIELNEAGGNLCLSTNKAPELKKASMDISSFDKAVIDTVLPMLHKSGYDEIEFTFDEPKLIKAIQHRINSMLIGYEIIEQTNKRCLIRSIASEYDSNIDVILRRTFLVTLSLAKNYLEAIKTGKLNDVEELLVLEETNNKLTNFCERILNKNPHNGSKTVYLYIIIWLLEKIADDYKDICRLISTKNIKLNKELIDINEKIVNLFENYYHLFYKFDFERMKAIKQEHKKIIDELHKLTLKGNNELLVYLFDLTQRIYDCFASTTGLQF